MPEIKKNGREVAAIGKNPHYYLAIRIPDEI
jgi:hypothetical protein